jgi:hypothetical protein
MHPLLEELATRTGQYIDLYGGASFAGEDLMALREIVERVGQEVATMPEKWDVQVGTLLVSPPTPLYAPVEKGEFHRRLSDLGQLVDDAIMQETMIRCIGD